MNSIFVVVCVVFFGFVIFACVQSSNEHNAKLSQYKSTCKVIGDAYDDGGDSSTTRTIYQCPDGLIHIM